MDKKGTKEADDMEKVNNYALRRRMIALCLEHPQVIEDYPFGDSNWAVMRHEGNRKSFAFIYEHQGELWLNLKNTPERNDFLRESMPEIIPAYHMNKTHWITLRMTSESLYPVAEKLIAESFQLTKPKPKRRAKNQPLL